MKASRKTHAAADLELTDIAVPTPRSTGDMLMCVTATGICSSDLHVDDWTPSYTFITANLPVTLGHRFVGVVQNGAGGQWNDDIAPSGFDRTT